MIVLPGILKTHTNQKYNGAHPIVMCGAGPMEMDAMLQLGAIGEDVDCICLFDYEGEDLWGIPVISPEALLEMEKTTTILLSPVYATQILYNTLTQGGFTQLFGIADMHMGNPFHAERNERSILQKIVDENDAEIKTARELLSDGKSKKIFDTRINAYLSDDWTEMEHLCEPNQYFVDGIIRLEADEEVFADCGTFDFDTSLEFILRTETRYKHIYAFDPIPMHVRKIELMIRRFGLQNISLFRVALGDKKRKIMLYMKGEFSSTANVNMDGTLPCQMDSLDHLLNGKAHPPTFIKMDIENMEVYALKGARNTIRQHKPKLAISAYHSLEHLWQVPLLIHEISPEYRLYLRHHSTVWETVCYGVTKQED
jgi:FkbM family methyltransferase